MKRSLKPVKMRILAVILAMLLGVNATSVLAMTPPETPPETTDEAPVDEATTADDETNDETAVETEAEETISESDIAESDSETEVETEDETTPPTETATEDETETEVEIEPQAEDFDVDAWFSEFYGRIGEDGLITDDLLETARTELTEKVGAEMAAEILAVFDEDYGVAMFGVSYPTRYPTPDKCPTDEEVYQKLMSFKNKEGYREGTPWTNHLPYGDKGDRGASYIFQGGYNGFRKGVGCAGWAFEMSDALFGDLPGQLMLIANNPQLADPNSGVTLEKLYNMIRPGDILRLENGSHFVIIAAKSEGGVIVTEANFNKSVHYGRALSKDEVLRSEFFYYRHKANCVQMTEEQASATKVVNGKTLAGETGSLNWKITNAGELVISGSGAIADYEGKTEGMEEDDFRFEYTGSAPPWYEYRASIVTITLGNGVTAIGKNAFFDCNRLLQVNLPSTLAAINEGGFRETTLMSITIPGSVKTIGKDAFRKCTALTSVTLEEGVETLEDGAFRACTALRSIVFPASTQKIGAAALFDCHELKNVSFKESSNTIQFGWDVFRRCWNMETINLPKNMNEITPGMFTTCMSLKQIYIPGTITAIGKPAGTVGAQNPFTDAGFVQKDDDAVQRMIAFGGSKSDWDALIAKADGAELKTAMKDAKIRFGASYKNPFAPLANEENKDILDAEYDANGKPIKKPDEVAHVHEFATANVWDNDASGHWHPCLKLGCDLDLTKGAANAAKNGFAAHDFGDWAEDKAAAPGEAGTKHRDCKICTYREFAAIAALRTNDLNVKPLETEITTTNGGKTVTLGDIKTTNGTINTTAKNQYSAGNNAGAALNIVVEAKVAGATDATIVVSSDAIGTLNQLASGNMKQNFPGLGGSGIIAETNFAIVEVPQLALQYAVRGKPDGTAAEIVLTKSTTTSGVPTTTTNGTTADLTGATALDVTIKPSVAMLNTVGIDRDIEITMEAPANAEYADVYYVNGSKLQMVQKSVKVEGGNVSFSVNHLTKFVAVKAEAPVVVPVPEEAKPHNWSAMYSTSATEHWFACTDSGCAVTTRRGAHVFGLWLVDTAATATTAGTQHRFCLTCDVRQNGTVSTTGEITESPVETNSNPGAENPGNNPGSGNTGGSSSSGGGNSPSSSNTPSATPDSGNPGQNSAKVPSDTVLNPFDPFKGIPTEQPTAKDLGLPGLPLPTVPSEAKPYKQLPWLTEKPETSKTPSLSDLLELEEAKDEAETTELPDLVTPGLDDVQIVAPADEDPTKAGQERAAMGIEAALEYTILFVIFIAVLIGAGAFTVVLKKMNSSDKK